MTATSNGAKSALQDCVEIRAGKLKGIFDPSQFGPGGRSLCITMPSKAVGDVARIVNPIEFEAMSDLSQCHAWKRSLRVSSLNKTLGQLIDSGDLKICDKKCSCRLCQKSNDYMIKKRRASLTNKKDDMPDDLQKHATSWDLNTSCGGNGVDPNHRAVSPSKSAGPLDMIIVKESEGEQSSRQQFPPLTSLLDYNDSSYSSNRGVGKDLGHKREVLCATSPAKRSRNDSDKRSSRDNLQIFNQNTHGRILHGSNTLGLSYPTLSITTEIPIAETVLPPLTPLTAQMTSIHNGGCKDSDSDSGISNISNLSNRKLPKTTSGMPEECVSIPASRVPSIVSNSVSLSAEPSNAEFKDNIISISNVQSNKEKHLTSPTHSSTKMTQEIDNFGVSTSPSSNAIPDYTSMVREAIASISMAVPNHLCQVNTDQSILAEHSSRLLIILYILNKYKPSENINIVYTKVNTALSLLERMGIVDKHKLNGNEDADSDLEEEDHLRSRPEQTVSTTEESLNTVAGDNSIGKKKVAKNSFKNILPDKNKLSQVIHTSSSPTGDLRDKINAKRNRTSDSSNMSALKSTNTTNGTPASLKKKVGKKSYIGVKINGGEKSLKENRISATEKILKIKKTKDGSKKSLSSSIATKENQKTKMNKGKQLSKGDGTDETKPKSPLDKTSKAPPAMRQYRLKRLSPELAAICGKKKLSRHDVVSRMWRYIKKKQLQDPNQRTTILCDEKLKALTQKPSIGQSDMLLCIGSHLTLIH